MAGLFVNGFSVIEPAADAGLGLPGLRAYVGKLAPFNVEGANLVDCRIPVLLRVNGLVRSVELFGRIIEVRDGLKAIAIQVMIIGNQMVFLLKGKPTVGIEQVRLIVVDDLVHDLQPVFMELFILSQPDAGILAIRRRNMLIIVMVEVAIGWVIAVVRYVLVGTIGVMALVGTPPGKGGTNVLRHAKGQTIFLGSSLPKAADILVRSHVNAVEAIQFRSVIKEMIMMRGLCHKVACAGLIVFSH